MAARDRRSTDEWMPAGFEARLSIVAAIERIVQEKPLSRVSVNEICESANTSRGSFYYYFANKYEAINWHSSNIVETGMREMGRTLNCTDAYLYSLRKYRAYGSLYSNIMAHDKKYFVGELALGYKTRRTEDLRETLAVYHGVELDESLMMSINYIVGAERNMMSKFIVGRPDLSDKEYAVQMASVLPASIRSYLESPVESNDKLFLFA